MPIYAYKCESCGHCQGRAAENVRCAPDGVPGLRRRPSTSSSPRPVSSSRDRAGTSPISAAAPAMPRPSPQRRPTIARPKPSRQQAVRERRRRPNAAEPARPSAAARPRPRPPSRRSPRGCGAPWSLNDRDGCPAQMAAGRPAGHRAAWPSPSGCCNWIIGTLDQTLLILPASWQPDRLLGVPHPRLRRAADAGHPAGGRRRPPATSSARSWWAGAMPLLQPHPGGALHLFQRQAGLRHAVLRKRQRVSHRGAGAVAARRRLDHRLRHRRARRRRGQPPAGDDYLSVYVPTTPNPTGGYFVMLKSSDCIELKMSVDEALKYVVSMGVVVPAARSTLRQIEERARAALTRTSSESRQEIPWLCVPTTAVS